MPYSEYISPEHLNAIIQIANKKYFNSIDLDFCTIFTDGSHFKLSIQDTTIVSFFDISDYTVELLNRAINGYKSPLNIESIVEELKWNFCEQENGSVLFETPYKNLKLQLTPNDNYTEWTIHYPHKIPNSYNVSYPSYASAISAAAVFMTEYDPIRIEYQKMIYDETIDTFTECEEIPNETAHNLVEHNIYSFEEILENTELLSENKEDIIDVCKELSGSDSEPKNSDKLQKYRSKIALDNI